VRPSRSGTDNLLDACRELSADRDRRHKVVTYEEAFDVRTDGVAESGPTKTSDYVYHGVLRCGVLSRHARLTSC